MAKTKNLQCKIAGIQTCLPEKTLTNETLASRHPSWTPQAILEKTGISKRHVVSADEYVSDLATLAAKRVISEQRIPSDTIEALILCTQTPDYALPSTSAIIHSRLGLAPGCLTFDFNQGCTGFIYGLSIAGSMIHAGLVNNVLLITAETYSRWCHPLDTSVSAVFGDGAAAILLQRDLDGPGIGPFLFGTDGRGAPHLMVPVSGAHAIKRDPDLLAETVDESGNVRTPAHLYMNGPELFRFAISSVPKLVHDLLHLAGKTEDDIDTYLFHQANAFMLKNIQKKLNIPDSKMIYALNDTGNTVCASIPLAMRARLDQHALSPGDRLLLIGFGVGYSWAGCCMTWKP